MTSRQKVCHGMGALPLFAGGFLFGVFLRTPKPVRSSVHADELRFGTPSLINPLLECDSADPGASTEFLPLKNKIQAVIVRAKQEGRVQDASVYFRGMKTGRWFGIDEDASYDGASLMKLPFLIAYYKQADDDPSILSKQILFDGSDKVPGQAIQPPHPLVKGQNYSVADLLFHMIVDSDNEALALLKKSMDPALTEGVYHDLNIPVDEDGNSQQIISAQAYSYFFRVLYNATYLSRRMSTQALQMMTQTEFKDGLVAGVPSDIPVAHKFGERVIMDPIGQVAEVDLHDCGITYIQRHAYFLCVMTRGKSLDTAATVIRDIATNVYSVVANDYHMTE